ncbi:MAG TPA: heparin lyase I family protein [Myxococcales bacterium]|nr:heparin lyase I family protein [Myxococcales bacterium]
MKLSQLAAAAVVFLAGSATEPAFAATDNQDVIWRGDFDDGQSSLGGHCNYGDNGWCGIQTIRPEQIQLVTDPAFQNHGLAARLEVKYGDVFRTYSDSRTIITPPPQMWEDEGSERWYRWQAMWPDNWVGDYPKWDELTDGARSSAGSIVEWHHDANGQVETGSAPLYIGANNTNIWMCLVDQATSTCRETLTLATLLRNHWHDFVMHAKWSSDPNVGFLEMWIDGVYVLQMHRGPNKYPGMRNYLSVGLYRNGHIGDPNMLWPDGTHVYGTDGTPGVAYVDGFIAGYTRAAVEPPAPTSPAPPDQSGTAPATSTGSTAANFGGGSGGCASSGAQMAWLALPGIVLFALRRRRRAQA